MCKADALQVHFHGSEEYGPTIYRQCIGIANTRLSSCFIRGSIVKLVAMYIIKCLSYCEGINKVDVFGFNAILFNKVP